MTASTPSLSSGSLAGLGLSSNGAAAGAAATAAPRGQAADASSANGDDSFRKLLGQGGSARNRNDAQAKNKTGDSSSGTPASQDARSDDDAQAQTSASASAAAQPAAKAGKPGDDDKDSAAGNDDDGSVDTTSAVWVAGLPLPGLPATPATLGGAIQAATANGTAAPTLPAGLQAATALATQPAGASMTTMTADGAAADTPPSLVTALPLQTPADAAEGASTGTNTAALTPQTAQTATTLAQSANQALSANPSQADTASASKAASAALAAIAPALVQPLQAGDAGKNADGIDLAALGLVATGPQPAQATLQPTTAVFPPTLPAADLDAGQFDQAIGARLTWMADQKIGHAHIKVSPEGMGQIEVQMKLDGSRVHADFNASQPEVRHALESSLPRLREMLDQQGFQLTQANVGQGQQQFSDARQSSAEGSGQDGATAQAGSAGNGSAVASATVALPAHGLGLLDAYA